MKRIGSIILSMLCFFVMTGCQTVQQYPRVPQSVPLSTTETTEPPTESVPETMATTTIRGPSYPQETVSHLPAWKCRQKYGYRRKTANYPRCSPWKMNAADTPEAAMLPDFPAIYKTHYYFRLLFHPHSTMIFPL